MSNASAAAFLSLQGGRRIAYARMAAAAPTEQPGVVFMGGFRSDMTGSKALALEAWARETGRSFLRFDYTGHGASSGAFEDGAIGDWADDAYQAFSRLTEGPQILVGSSMGGWIALLTIRRLAAEGAADRVAGLVGVAAAPDFTEDLIWARMSEATRAELMAKGRIEEASPYDPEPTVITRRLIEDGRENLVLRSPLALAAPARLLHGSADPDVPLSVGLSLLAHLDCPDARLTVLKDAGHRLSEPHELDLLITTVADLCCGA